MDKTINELMQMNFDKHQQTTDEAKKILASNQQKLKRLNSRKYLYLCGLLRSDVGKFLDDILSYWLKRDKCIRNIKGNPFFFLGTHAATFKVRRRTTTAVSNRWLNYLCAVGLLTKSRYNTQFTAGKLKLTDKSRRQKMTKSQRQKLKLNIKPINTFKVIAYNPDLFKACEERVRLLKAKGITPGNISYLTLTENGLRDIAKEVFLEERLLAEEKKQREYEELVGLLDSLIDLNGYTTKQEVKDNSRLPDKEIDTLFKLYGKRLKQTRKYKPPTQAEIELFGLTDRKFIWIKK